MTVTKRDATDVSHSHRMTWSSHAAAILVLAGVAVAIGCTGDDSDAGSTVDVADGAAGAPQATLPTTTSARSTPFCVGMIELAEELDEAGPGADTAAIIRSAYADLADVVPAEIRADFDAVRQLLVDDSGSAPPTTTDEGDASDATAAVGDGEGTSLADTPTERIADYVDLNCRGTANNPGPAETQPEAPPATDG